MKDHFEYRFEGTDPSEIVAKLFADAKDEFLGYLEEQEVAEIGTERLHILFLNAMGIAFQTNAALYAQSPPFLYSVLMEAVAQHLSHEVAKLEGVDGDFLLDMLKQQMNQRENN